MDAKTAGLLLDMVELLIEMNDIKIDKEFLESPLPSELMHDRIAILRGRLHAEMPRAQEQADGSV